MSLRERRRRETLAAIREAAAMLFAERGFAATRTRDIAEAAGIATGTLFNYAPTKEAVVLLLWKDRARTAADAGLAAARQEEEPVDALVALFQPILAFYDEDHELGRVFLQLAAFTGTADEDLMELNTGFVVQIAELTGGGLQGISRASNAFAAYFMVVTGLLNGTVPSVHVASSTLRMLFRAQVDGWQTSS